MIKFKENLENISIYSTQKYPTEDILMLNSNENQYGPSKKVIKALADTQIKDILNYPYYGKLMDKLCEIYKLKENNLLISNGADEAIYIIINSILEKEEEVLSFSPTFSMPKIYAQISNGSYRGIEYLKKWEFDPNLLISNISDKTKIIYMASPNNPTGEITKKEDVEFVLKNAPNCLVLLDITYINFASDNQDYFDLLNKYDNLAIVKSLSKDFAIAGLRCGFIASNTEIINECKKVISPYSVNSIAINCATAALCDKKYTDEIIKKINITKDKMHKNLEELGYTPYNSQGNFILCDFKNDCEFIYKKLKLAKIKVRKFAKNSVLNSCLRITIPKQNDYKRFFEAIKIKDLLVFDLDGVVFNVDNSYRLAIKKTYEHFAKKELDESKIKRAKEVGGLNCDWDLTKYLLDNDGHSVEFEEMKEVFQSLFFNPNSQNIGYIDNEELVLSAKTLKKLSSQFDFAVFTGRPKAEALYSLEKYGILKYFIKIITVDDLKREQRKPSPDGLNIIKSSIKHNSVYYFGDTIDDIISGVNSNTKVFAVVNHNDKSADLLLEAGASATIKDFSKLDKFLKLKGIAK